MSIEGVLAFIDPEIINRDCILHSVLRVYMDTKTRLSACNASETDQLTRQLDAYAQVLMRLLDHAKCFPAACHTCEGLTKCMDCIINANCVDAHVIFYRWSPLLGSA